MDKQMPFDKQRRFPRISVNEPIQLHFRGDKGNLTGFLVDLSLGGAYVRCAMPVEVGREMICAFSVSQKDKPRPIKCVGKVMWTATHEVRRAKGPGFGVTFSNLSTDTVEVLKQYTGFKDI